MNKTYFFTKHNVGYQKIGLLDMVKLVLYHDHHVYMISYYDFFKYERYVYHRKASMWVLIPNVHLF